MTRTTHPEYHADTEALEVAKAFPESIRGRTILVTGVNREGIGFATSEAFASQSPAHLIIAGRTPSKLQQSIEALKSAYPNVKYRALKLDLSNQKGVREAAAQVLSWNDVLAIDILVNSAGVMLIPERTLSEDGIEIHFATNHIGHFLFTNLILSKLIEAAKNKPKGIVRVINLSSSSPLSAGARWSDINFDKINKTLPQDEQPVYDALKAWGTAKPEEKTYIPREGYNQSKVANALFSIALNQKFYHKYGFLSLAVNPGVIAAELNRSSPPEVVATIQSWGKCGKIHIKKLGAGASTTLVAATDPQLGLPTSKNGRENYGAYLADCNISDEANSRARSITNAERLWNLLEGLVKEKFH
ncbi:uncharacterized protein A1O9_08761 [Exophiala aquamarina CBS 119918]|uniref:Alcohol dehydrogenase n=1 Tax=Exophiala aquamarina CBS 119918 TaxID=1182545 RepID=A0A072P751_9EURO|nr:uncharacterized protein A1O9_08761 [Exophiala aquamarina CBS 119918]KEF55108.1 hypothetical protein A1O9_08761 [Exophiala aquamarina CBS 119918]